MARHVSMDTFTSLLEVLGAALIAVGCFLLWLPVGFLATGAELVLAGWLLAPAPARGGRR